MSSVTYNLTHITTGICNSRLPVLHFSLDFVTFNNLAIGSFFSGPTIVKSTAHLNQDEAEFSGRGTIVSYRNGLNADANRDSGCFP